MTIPVHELLAKGVGISAIAEAIGLDRKKVRRYAHAATPEDLVPARGGRRGSLRHSTAAPAGLPGGYPVRIVDGSVALDLPPGLSEADAIAFNERMAGGDGIDHIDDDGTVHLTAATDQAVAEIAPDLAYPIAIDDLADRTTRLDSVLTD